MLQCRKCSRETYKDSSYCVFHYGWEFKEDLDKLAKREVDEEWVKTKEALIRKLEPIKGEFISQFRAYVKEVLNSQKRILDLSHFVFPAFTKKEWAQLWRDLGADEDGDGVDLQRLNVGIRFYGAVFLGETRFVFWRFGDGVWFGGAKIYAPISFNSAQFGNQVMFIRAVFKFNSGDGMIDFVRAKFGDSISFDGVQIYAPISFLLAKFGNQVSFINTTFKFNDGNANFSRTQLGNSIAFDGAQIYVPISFNGAQFGNQVSFVGTIFNFEPSMGLVDFVKVKFGNSISFYNAQINAPINFGGAQFGNQVSFVKAIFDKGNVSFSESIFGNFISFAKSKIRVPIDFNGAQFGDGFFFDRVQIRAPISFNGTQFGNQVSFIETSFNGGIVDFIKAKFGDSIWFDRAQIYALINFNGAKFGSKVSFIRTIFKFDGGEVNFQGVRFGDSVWFDGARIYTPISFNDAQFGNKVSFVKAIFKFNDGKVYFIRTKFGDGVSFDEARIYVPISFNGAQFGNHVSFVGTIFKFNNGKADFARAKFGDGIAFDGAYICTPISFNGAQFGNQVSFVETTFTLDEGKVDFVGAKFGDSIFFDKAQIYAPISFSGAQFGNQISFIKVSFKGRNNKINPVNPKFNNVVEFTNTKFAGNVKFDYSIFVSPIFTSCEFSGNTSFNGSKFISHVLFNNSIFMKQVSFWRTIFELNNNKTGKIDFRGALLYKINFVETRVKTNNVADSKVFINLKYSSINGQMILLKNSENITFSLENLTFLSDGHIRTDIQTIKSIIWKGTNLFQDHPRVFLTAEEDVIHGWDIWPPRFSQEDWQNRLGRLIELWGSLEEAERIYRQVRLIMEYNGRFSDAGELYIMEMYLRTIRLLGSDRNEMYDRNVKKILDTINPSCSIMQILGYLLRVEQSEPILKYIFGLLATYVLLLFSILILHGAFILDFIRISGIMSSNCYAQQVLGYLLRASFDQYEPISKRFLGFIVSNILLLFSLMILPSVSIWDFLSNRKLSFIQAVLHTYYGLLGGWGEKIDRPVAHLILSGIYVGILMSLLGQDINASKIDPFFNKLVLMILHSIYITIIPFSSPDRSPFWTFYMDATVLSGTKNFNMANFLIIGIIVLLAKIYGLTLLTILTIALKRKFSRISAQ